MSKAKPMSETRRTASYIRAGRSRFTPRQWRRVRHKYNRANGGYYGHWGDAGKGRSTPRQPAHAGGRR